MNGEPGVDEKAEPPEPSQPSATPWRVEISSVTGRRAGGGKRGLAAIDQLSFRIPDGKTHDFGPPRRGEQEALQLVAPISARAFQSCPICIDGEPTDKEHVPQQNLGGQVMTWTCKACNNGLGSRVEAALQDWFDHAYRRVTFEGGDVPGRRRVSTIYYRQARDGSFCLIIDGALTPDVKQMFASGQFTMNYSPADARRRDLALLKHAYLAACLCLQIVPDTEEARAIRADLIAARDATTAAQLPDSEAAKRLTVYRSHVGRQGPPLALVAKSDPETDAEPEILISLAGVLAVSWPFTDLPPGT